MFRVNQKWVFMFRLYSTAENEGSEVQAYTFVEHERHQMDTHRTSHMASQMFPPCRK